MDSIVSDTLELLVKRTWFIYGKSPIYKHLSCELSQRYCTRLTISLQMNPTYKQLSWNRTCSQVRDLLYKHILSLYRYPYIWQTQGKCALVFLSSFCWRGHFLLPTSFINSFPSVGGAKQVWSKLSKQVGAVALESLLRSRERPREEETWNTLLKYNYIWRQDKPDSKDREGKHMPHSPVNVLW